MPCIKEVVNIKCQHCRSEVPPVVRSCAVNYDLDKESKCCMKDGSRPTTVVVQAGAVNRLSVLVQ